MSLNSLALGRLPRFVSLYAFLAAMVAAPSAMAVPAHPDAYTDVQPDGQRVTLRLNGDEHFNWSEDLAGYTVIQHQGWYEYARLNPQGKLVPAGLKVGRGDPAAFGLQKKLLPAPAQRAPGKSGGGSGGDSPQGAAPQGTVRNLVILVQFSNHVGRALPSSGDIEVLMNAPGGDPVLAPTGSLRDVYLANSYGQFELNSDIAAWVTVSNTEQYYANGNSGDSTLWQALREALNVVDQTVDFRNYDGNGDGQIDAITFLHSGYGAEWGGSDADGTTYTSRIWSHRWTMSPGWTSREGVTVSNYHISPALWGTSGSRIGRIGVIAHETGHFFGLPDLYDTDGGGSGIGSYGLMANSWDFNGTQLCPPHFSPWSKMQLGWINPVNISGPGEYSIDRSADNNDYFVIRTGFPANEFLLIENRQRAGFDCSLPQGGLAIWHIDEEAGFNTEGYPGGRWPSDGRHYRVALAQADGGFHLERGYNRGDSGDVHHGAGVDAIAPGPDGHPNTDAYQGGRIVITGNTISNISASGYTMSFCLNGCGGTGGTGGSYDAPSALAASVTVSGSRKSQVKNVSLSWTDNSNGDHEEDSFVIERCEETGKGKTKTCAYAQHAVVGRNVNGFSETTGSGTYQYRVKARSSVHGDSGYSNEVKI